MRSVCSGCSSSSNVVVCCHLLLVLQHQTKWLFDSTKIPSMTERGSGALTETCT